MPEIEKIWEQILSILKKELNETSYNTWFKPLSPKSINKDVKILYLETEDNFVRDVIYKRYIDNLTEKAETVFGEPYKVIINLKNSEDEDIINSLTFTKPDPEEEKAENNPKSIHVNENIINPKYNFDSFVVGDNNWDAYSIAKDVAESPSVAFNPFYLFGKSGLGKTHLMHSIGKYILENHPEKKVLYVSSEMFTTELIRSLHVKGTSMRAFKSKYRNLDVLLIDDIQFMQNKETTQEEFFHTFNALYNMNKQIVISSDCDPKHLKGLDERLTSRFKSNVAIEIKAPDYETRVAILHKKAIEYIEEKELNIVIDDDFNETLEVIAKKIKTNVRELEGALTRLITFSITRNERITVKFARKYLPDIFSAQDFQITCETIKKTVCKKFNIKMNDIESSKRTRDLAYPRQIAMYLCREITGTSLPKIGEYFGGKNHTTVLHACDKIAADIEINENTARIIEELTEELNNN